MRLPFAPDDEEGQEAEQGQAEDAAQHTRSDGAGLATLVAAVLLLAAALRADGLHCATRGRSS